MIAAAQAHSYATPQHLIGVILLALSLFGLWGLLRGKVNKPVLIGALVILFGVTGYLGVTWH